MNQKAKLYDVYVSYPPDVDRERINACLYDNLPENEAEDLVQALAERPQAIIAENCTQEERENAQHYFNYLGLDVIVRYSLELAPNSLNPDSEEAAPAEISQCPVCLTIVEDPTEPNCVVCDFQFSSATPQVVDRKRIEWQEKLAFEHKKQTEIAHKLKQEREREEKILRKQIRAELEEKLLEELGKNPDLVAIAAKRKNILIGVVAFILMIILVAAGYFSAKLL
ncbi:hypothetical protein GJV52_07620 [Neisseria brasiliensis]|uniref:hypothetical protein n=1 Tax=Neisseria TaxID=482 RepID=UPI000C27CC22|nr:MULTISPECIES: hypothetical protein [Neisseria]PJO78677.1 hypothetical protein CWC45_04005 [Neisseria sp. N177_16]QGL25414.1 hypothetical protein GJV52_07620 [Neisseria brasiliensis]